VTAEKCDEQEHFEAPEGRSPYGSNPEGVILFLCIGNGQIIDIREIVMIIDMRKAKWGQFSSLKQKAKAAILLEDGSFHLSGISARAIGKRFERLGGKQ